MATHKTQTWATKTGGKIVATMHSSCTLVDWFDSDGGWNGDFNITEWPVVKGDQLYWTEVRIDGTRKCYSITIVVEDAPKTTNLDGIQRPIITFN